MKLGDILSLLFEEGDYEDSIDLPPTSDDDYGIILLILGFKIYPIGYNNDHIWWWSLEPKEGKIVSIHDAAGLEQLIKDLKSNNIHDFYNDDKGWDEFTNGKI